MSPTAGLTYWAQGTNWVSRGRASISAGPARAALVPGDFFPDASTVGITSVRSALTVSTGSTLTFSTPGETVRDKWFQQYVDVAAANVTFENCWFSGPNAAQNRAVVNCTNAAVSNAQFTDCTFAPQVLGSGTNNVYGHHYTLTRCELKWATDCASVVSRDVAGQRAEVVIEGSWLHHPTFFSPDPLQNSNATHNDLIQWHGGKGLTLTGNRFDGFYNPDAGNSFEPNVVDGSGNHVSGNQYYPSQCTTSCLLLIKAGSRDAPDEMVATKNWFNGGGACLVLSSSTTSFLTAGSSITANFFGTDMRNGADFGVLATTAQVFTLTGNHRWNPNSPFDTSTSFNIRKAG